MDYKGDVTVKIDGIAASAASVIAMAGTEVLMAPTALMMIHNPLTVAIGDSEEMQKAIAMRCRKFESRFLTKATICGREIASLKPCSPRKSQLPTGGTSLTRTTRGITTAPLTWRKFITRRNELWLLSVLTDFTTRKSRRA